MGRTRRQRRLIFFLGAAALATLALGAGSLWKLAPRLVTWLALRDAGRLVAELRPEPVHATKSLAAAYGSLFRAGYFDHAYMVDRIPAQGYSPEAFPAFVVLATYFEVCSEGSKEDLDVSRELLSWLCPIMMSARAKEALVSLLLEPYEITPGRKEPGGMFKREIFRALSFRDPDSYGKSDRIRPMDGRVANQVLSAIPAREWRAVLEHSHHPSERVRAGSLLLLWHHPEREVFLVRGREALRDPSQLVRIAASGILAYHGDAGGRAHLVSGLDHDRWEVRWWCGRCLTYLGQPEDRAAVSRRRDREPDGWVEDEMKDMLRAFP